MARFKSKGSTKTLGSADQELRTALNVVGEGDFQEVELDTIILDPGQPRTLSIEKDFVKEISSHLLEFKEKNNTLPEANEFKDILLKLNIDSIKIINLLNIYHLACSIQNTGLVHNPVVYIKGRNKVLIAGERRTLAHVLLGERIIKCFVHPKKLSEIELREIQLIENINRVNLIPIEIAEALEKLILLHEEKTGKVFTSRMVEKIGLMGKSQANKYLRLNKANKIKESFFSKEISFSQANKANKLVDEENLTEEKAIKKVLEKPKNTINLPKIKSKTLRKLLIKFSSEFDYTESEDDIAEWNKFILTMERD